MERMQLLRRIGAVVLWLAGLAFLIYGVATTGENVWTLVSLGLGGMAFGIVGLLLALKARGVMGWLFLTTQLLMALTLTPIETTSTGLLITVALILLVFPSGRLPSPRWRPAAWALSLAFVLWVLFDLLKVAGEIGDDLGWLVFMVLVFPLLVASPIRLINDYRRSRGETRQQLKWLAWVFLVGGAALLLSFIPMPYVGEAHVVAGVILLVGSPIAIGIAVTRYRLYELDRIVSRTVTYTIVVGLLATAIAALAALVGTRFESPLVVAATTLGAAAIFTPLRIRVQRWVDRRFNRSRYDRERIAEQFAGTLRDDIELEGLIEGWLGVAVQTMQPRTISVWTRTS